MGSIFAMRNVIIGTLFSLSVLLHAEQAKPPLYFNYNNIGFSATGRWMPADSRDKAAFPREVEIDCERNTKLCTEAIAEYTDGQLHVSIDYLQIEKWDSNGIVASSSDSLCTLRNVTISFGDKTIVETLSAKSLDKKKLLESCKFFGDRSSATSRLVVRNSNEWIADPYGEGSNK